ncbi:MAG: TolC family protein [Proteobacteria bacterium]|nr:TolC family protein [Pseudomonadota bacterium]MCP4915724.1 TolC family protein [Pseudomonadota bacterium]
MTLLPLLLAAEAQPLSYEQALALAIEANPDVAMAQMDAQAAESRVMSAQSVWDPYLTANLGRAYNLSEQRADFGFYYELETTSLMWSSQLAQTLPTGTSWSLDWQNSSQDVGVQLEADNLFEVEDFASGSSSLTASVTQQVLKGHRMAYNLQAINSAKASLTIAEASVEQQRQTVLSEVASAYWDLVYAGEALATAREAVDVAQEEQRIVAAQLDAGNMAPVELTRVQAAVAQTQLALIESDNLHQAASYRLSTLLAMDGTPLEPTTEPGDIPTLDLDLGRAIEATLAGNPGIKVQEALVANAEANLASAKHGRLPTLSVTGSAGWRGYDDEVGGGYSAARSEVFGRQFPTRYVGADLSVPLLNRAARGEMNAQAAETMSAEYQLQQLEQTLSEQVAGLVRDLETATRRLELAELNLRLAEETLAAEKALQNAGRAIQKDILAAQRERDAARVEVVKARTDFQKSLVTLEGLQGRL